MMILDNTGNFTCTRSSFSFEEAKHDGIKVLINVWEGRLLESFYVDIMIGTSFSLFGDIIYCVEVTNSYGKQLFCGTQSEFEFSGGKVYRFLNDNYMKNWDNLNEVVKAYLTENLFSLFASVR